MQRHPAQTKQLPVNTCACAVRFLCISSDCILHLRTVALLVNVTDAQRHWMAEEATTLFEAPTSLPEVVRLVRCPGDPCAAYNSSGRHLMAVPAATGTTCPRLQGR